MFNYMKQQVENRKKAKSFIALKKTLILSNDQSNTYWCW